MRNVYKIADITIGIDYQYKTYLDHNIETYLADDTSIVKHNIQVVLSEHIDLPIGKTNQTKNPYVILESHQRIIYALTKNGEVKECITHDSDFKHVEIKMNPKLISNPAEMEYALIGLIFMDIALKNGYISLHASAIEYQGKAVLFSAPSQTGKSTHARYWMNTFENIRLINDDKPLIQVNQGDIYVYGSPFSGKSKLNHNIKVPLKAIVFIKQGLTNRVETLCESVKIKELFKNMMRPDDEDIWNQTIRQLNVIIERIPMYSIEATNDQSSVHAIHKVIYNQETKNEN
jgi:hypothetical protein